MAVPDPQAVTRDFPSYGLREAPWRTTPQALAPREIAQQVSCSRREFLGATIGVRLACGRRVLSPLVSSAFGTPREKSHGCHTWRRDFEKTALSYPVSRQQGRRCYWVLVACTSSSTEGATIRSSTACGFPEASRNSIFRCCKSGLTTRFSWRSSKACKPISATRDRLRDTGANS